MNNINLVLDIAKIVMILVVRLVMIVLGLFVVLVALPFARPTIIPDQNQYGWERWHLPRWAWPWDNDRNGVFGTQFSDGPLSGRGRGFWWRYYWTAIRNPANNFSTKVIGFPTDFIKYIDYAGTEQEADEHVPGWSYYRAHTDIMVFPGFVWSGSIGSRRFSFYAGWKIRMRYQYETGRDVGFTVAFERWG